MVKYVISILRNEIMPVVDRLMKWKLGWHLLQKYVMIVVCLKNLECLGKDFISFLILGEGLGGFSFRYCFYHTGIGTLPILYFKH